MFNEKQKQSAEVFYKKNLFLSLNVPIQDKYEKLTSTFIFTLLSGASKRFMKALKASIKPFEAPQRSEKKKLIFASIQLSKMHRTGRVKNFAIFTEKHLRC